MEDNTKICIKEIALKSAHFILLAYDTGMGVQL